jgi:AcrR family transcriptional regulator
MPLPNTGLRLSRSAEFLKRRAFRAAWSTCTFPARPTCCWLLLNNFPKTTPTTGARLWTAQASGPRQLRAIIDADFDPVVLNRRTMAVWFAFRGEAHSSPEYMPFIDSRDARMQQTITSICRELRDAGGDTGTDPQIAALSIIALLEGLWTDYYLHPDRFDRDTARAVVLHTARAFFPGSFNA